MSILRRCVTSTVERFGLRSGVRPTRGRIPIWRDRALLLVVVFLSHTYASAVQIDDPKVTEPAATEGSTQPYPYPKMEPARTLAGKALLDALRTGGYVLYMRHTETGTVTPNCNVSNLTPRGERDSARVGAALKSLAVPLSRIASSPVCRVQDTARTLGIGEFDLTEDLANVPLQPGYDFHTARGKLIATVPANGKNTLLVSHMQSGNDISQAIYLDFGEIVIFRPDGAGAGAAVGRVRVDDWALLVKSYADKAGKASK